MGVKRRKLSDCSDCNEQKNSFSAVEDTATKTEKTIIIHRQIEAGSKVTCFCGETIHTHGEEQHHECEEMFTGNIILKSCKGYYEFLGENEEYCTVCKADVKLQEEEEERSYRDRDGYVRCWQCDKKLTIGNSDCPYCFCIKCRKLKEDDYELFDEDLCKECNDEFKKTETETETGEETEAETETETETEDEE